MLLRLKSQSERRLEKWTRGPEGEERIETEDFLVGSVHQDLAVWKLIPTRDQLLDEWGLFWAQTFCPIYLTGSVSIIDGVDSRVSFKDSLITELPNADIASRPGVAQYYCPSSQ